jgi:hypothetical protein
MRKELKEILDEKWYSKLPNKECAHEKLLIGFSDIPGSGMTDDYSLLISGRYNGVWINKDAARTLIYENEKIESTQQVEDILDEYMDDCLDRLSKIKNGLLVLDAGIDRKYEFYRNWAKLNGYEMYIIGFIVTPEEVMNRVRKDRDKQTAEWFENQLERWYQDQNKFNELYGANFFINDNNLLEQDLLFEELDKIIK